MEFNERISVGKQGQDVIINFLERHFGYRFEAGERKDGTYNTDLIEELEQCEFIPAKMSGWKKHGNRLKFKDNSGETFILTMPDAFMSRNSTSGFYWVEAKRHTKIDNRLIIDKNNFDDYAILYKYFTRQYFLVMCLTPSENGDYDLYYCEMRELLETEPSLKTINKNSVYIWNMRDVMSRMNKYPINIDNYVD